MGTGLVKYNKKFMPEQPNADQKEGSLREKPKSLEIDVDALLSEVTEFVEKKEPTSEERYGEWNGLKESGDAVSVEILKAQARLDDPSLDMGMRNFGLALARVGVEARIQSLGDLEAVAADPDSSADVKKAAGDLTRLKTVREGCLAKDVSQKQKDEYVAKIDEAIKTIEAGVAPAVAEYKAKVQAELAPMAESLDKEIAETPQLEAAKRAEVEGQIVALEGRLVEIEGKQLELMGDSKNRDAVISEARRITTEKTTKQLETPEGRQEFAKTKLREIMKEAHLLMSPKELDDEFARRKTIDTFYRRENFVRDLITDMRAVEQSAIGLPVGVSEARPYDAAKKYSEKFGWSSGSWEKTAVVITRGLSKSEKFGKPDSLFTAFSGYVKDVAGERGMVKEEANELYERMFEGVAEAFSEHLGQPENERHIDAVAKEVGRRAERKVSFEMRQMESAHEEAKSLELVAEEAEKIIAEFPKIKSEVAEINSIQAELKKIKGDIDSYDRGRREAELRLGRINEGGYFTLEQKVDWAKEDLIKMREEENRHRDRVSTAIEVHGLAQDGAIQKRREYETNMKGVDSDGNSWQEILDGKPQEKISIDLARLKAEIDEKTRTRPKLFGRKEADDEIRSLEGNRNRLQLQLEDLNKKQKVEQERKAREEVEAGTLELEIKEEKDKLDRAEKDMEEAKQKVGACEGKLKEAKTALDEAKASAEAALYAFRQETEEKRAELLAKVEKDGSLKDRTKAVNARLEKLVVKFKVLVPEAKSVTEKAAKKSGEKGGKISAESVIVSRAQKRFGKAKDRLDKFVEDMGKKGVGERVMDHQAEEILGVKKVSL